MYFVKFADVFVIQVIVENNDSRYNIINNKLAFKKSFDFLSCIKQSINKFQFLTIPKELQKYVSILLIPAKINYYIVEEKQISQLNLLYYKKKYAPTDILTFPYIDRQTNILGEIFISPNTAISISYKKKEDVIIYCKRLLIHGFLHLLLGPHSNIFSKIENKLLKSIINITFS